jgi:serine/threonine protein kinase
VIGPYKLLEQIGEGGFGVVFLTEQQQPVRRKVALKVLKPGMDTRQVVARFEAERQVLAMLRGAASKGYKDAPYMKKDTDLDPLRQREDLQKLVAELEAGRERK